MKSAIESSSRSELDDNVPFGRKGGRNKLNQFVSRHAGERSLLVVLENVDTTSLDHFEKRTLTHSSCSPRVHLGYLVCT